jgi:2-polyprenyl-3-methyl-5-hydroxy-6-metoxy-1,4-benzoquinol methylase
MASANALEVGCSVGIFSGMLSDHFDKVTAIDISKEALRVAAAYNSAQKNIRFVHAHFESLEVDGQYDVIFCAEILYYVATKHIKKVCQQLSSCLAPKGIILLVTGTSTCKSSQYYFDGWEEILTNRFERIFARTFDDASRPYRIVVFSRSVPN